MRTRTLISSFIFLSLCAVKILLPKQAAEIREYIIPAITREADLRGDIIALGRAISGDGDYVYVWQRLLGGSSEKSVVKSDPELSPEPSFRPSSSNSSESFVLSNLISQNLRGYECLAGLPEPESSPAASCNPGKSAVSETSPPPSPSAEISAETPDPASAEKEAASARAAKAEAFLRQQSSFSDYSLPANVSLDASELPFKYSSPVLSVVSSGFGYRVHPIDGDVRFHYGTDFAVVDGSDVAAFADGTVLTVQEFDGYGLTVIIDHGSGYTTLYAHLGQALVKPGDKVSRGGKIALSGHSGRVTGPHLHFELMCGRTYLNPEFYC